ncbi:MAG TPA: nuclear transport factor 2 family protein, partial [Pyrinomonadaceae bacterium]|nr:nuclear transport factor 2 family protein [Pyrinomonadaceae bacterium]
RDRAAAERMLAEEFVRTGPRGEVWDRAQTLTNFPADDGTAGRSVHFEDERIRVYGDVAVVTGVGVLKGAEKSGGEFELRNRCTFVLVKSGGRWRAVAAQQTRAD